MQSSGRPHSSVERIKNAGANLAQPLIGRVTAQRSNRPAIEQRAQPLRNLRAKIGGALEIVPRAFHRE